MGDKPRRFRAAGILDIGSSQVRMGLYQTGQAGARPADAIQRLDTLASPLPLGHEVFTTGRISAETMRQLSRILKGYAQVMKEYGVTQCRAFATAAFREAQNRAYALDRLRIQNHLAIEVLEEGEESALVYSALLASPLEEEALLAYVGTGSIGAAYWRDGAVEQTGSMTIGFLKLAEMLRRRPDGISRYGEMLEEYIETYFHRWELCWGGKAFSQVLLAGRQMETMASLCGIRQKNGTFSVGREAIDALYDRIKECPLSVLAADMDGSEETAGQMVPMLALCRRMMRFTQAQKLIVSPVDLMDVAAGQLLVPAEKTAYEAMRYTGARSSCLALAKREGADTLHAERVRKTSVRLFHKLKKRHGLSGKRLVLLECAALLHEVGYRANVKNPPLATYDCIKQAYFMGLSGDEAVLVAEIACLGHPPHEAAQAACFPESQRLLIDKLTAILMIADALDSSRQGKIDDLHIRLEDDRVVITACGRRELLLEKWSFEEGAAYFENAFGIRPVLLYKDTLLAAVQ